MNSKILGLNNCVVYLSSISPLELPTDVTWEYILQSCSNFKTNPQLSSNDLTYYKGRSI